MISADKQVVIVPKGAITDITSSRNGLSNLLIEAGFEKVRNGLNRLDQITDGDFVFQAVKGAKALAIALEKFQNQSVGLLGGDDLVVEGDLNARKEKVDSDIKRIVTLQIGECSMAFLAPEEKPLASAEDLRGQMIFTKYPLLLQQCLNYMRINAGVRETDGADTRVAELRSGVAFEIVGSGETAKANRLQVASEQIQFPLGDSIDLPYVTLPNISTNFSVTQFSRLNSVSRIASRSRDMLRIIGLALEAARDRNTFASLKCNVDASIVGRFAGLGLRGPTVSEVLVKKGKPVRALEIFVPVQEVNAMRVKLLQLGAEDLGSFRPIHVEMNTESSDVLRAFPFDEKESPPEVIQETNDVEPVSRWLPALENKLSQSVKHDSSTTRAALEKGLEYCLGRYQVELTELWDAIRSNDRDNALLEGGQCIYWLLVVLKSAGKSLSSLIEIFDKREVGYSLNGVLPERILEVLQGIQSKMEPPIEAVESLLKQGIRLSTALRKGSTDDGGKECLNAFLKLFETLGSFKLDWQALMKEEGTPVPSS